MTTPADFKREIEEARKELGLEEAVVKDSLTAEQEVEDVVDQTSSEPTLSVEEEEAKKAGWDPNYQGENRVSAKEFLRYGSLLKSFKNSQKKVDELSDVVKGLSSHLKKTEKAAYEKALREIQDERRKAVELGDVDAFNLAEEKLNVTHEAIKQVEQDFVPSEQASPAQPIEPELLEFKEKHKEWFNTSTPENREMAEATVAADALVAKRAQRLGKTLTIKEHLHEVEEIVKGLYPHRFENQNRSRPAAVGTSTTSGSASKSSLSAKMSDRQKEFAKQAKSVDPSFDIEEYAKQLELIGELNK